MNEFFKGVTIGGMFLAFVSTLIFMWGFVAFILGHDPPDILFTLCVIIGAVGTTASVVGLAGYLLTND